MLTEDYGPHTEDQRILYWDGRYKPGAFQAEGLPEYLRGLSTRVYRDGFGVPAIYGDTSYDTWYGAGWTAGQDRLFLADGVRHIAKGTYSELAGPAGVPADIATRVADLQRRRLRRDVRGAACREPERSSRPTSTASTPTSSTSS